MLDIIASNQFRKDLKLAGKRGKDLGELRRVVNQLASCQPLAEKYHDHHLSGNYSGFRECHIEPDWLLIYRIDGNDLELFLLRTGSHSDLF
ncbi:MAG: type II toxin-antitoxin system YafQ family toxin [Eubacterium sp.]|nr:type II toxin-antitoxin system YafQ family toxin [Eubacterium sp.]